MEKKSLCENLDIALEMNGTSRQNGETVYVESERDGHKIECQENLQESETGLVNYGPPHNTNEVDNAAAQEVCLLCG